MKILVISPYLPYPLNSGGNQAVFAMIDYLRGKQEITFAMPLHSRDEQNFRTLQTLWPDVAFRPYRCRRDEVSVDTARINYGGEPDTFAYRMLKKAWRSLGRKMRRRRMAAQDSQRASSSLGLVFASNLSTSFLDFVYNEIVTGGYDIVQAEFYDMLPLAHIIPEGQTSVFVHHEIRFVRNSGEMGLFPEKTVLDEYLYQIEKAQELAALEKFTHIVTLSQTDEQILREELSNRNIYSSPAVIFTPRERETAFRPTSSELVFVGSSDHYPNRDAVEWFCREVAPLIGQPFTLHIVGQWCDTARQQLQGLPFVRFAGFVDDLADFINGKIMIVPIRIGSGIRMKIMDSVAAGTPFITTSKGVEGLDFVNGRECLVADDARGFAEAVDSLLQNAELQNELQKNAREKLLDLYNPARILERRNSLYERIYAEMHR